MVRRVVKVVGLAGAALAAASALGLQSAQATRTVTIPSHISIKGENLTFSGRVTSPNGNCLADRAVTLYRTNGDNLGSTHTSRHGHWSITAQGSAGITMGRFYAVVKQMSQGTAGTIYVCKGARSKTIGYQT